VQDYRNQIVAQRELSAANNAADEKVDAVVKVQKNDSYLIAGTELVRNCFGFRKRMLRLRGICMKSDC
jgi:hypothetical protein